MFVYDTVRFNGTRVKVANALFAILLTMLFRVFVKYPLMWIFQIPMADVISGGIVHWNVTLFSGSSRAVEVKLPVKDSKEHLKANKSIQLVDNVDTRIVVLVLPKGTTDGDRHQRADRGHE